MAGLVPAIIYLQHCQMRAFSHAHRILQNVLTDIEEVASPLEPTAA
jgi:hypothetical protein